MIFGHAALWAVNQPVQRNKRLFHLFIAWISAAIITAFNCGLVMIPKPFPKRRNMIFRQLNRVTPFYVRSLRPDIGASIFVLTPTTILLVQECIIFKPDLDITQVAECACNDSISARSDCVTIHPAASPMPMMLRHHVWTLPTLHELRQFFLNRISIALCNQPAIPIVGVNDTPLLRILWLVMPS